MTVNNDTLNWWTDVIVPLGAALIGGGFALLGALFGAKWAAREQRKYAEQIDRGRRRDDLEAKTLQELDDIVMRTESHAQAVEQHWATSPSSMGSNWGEELSRYLREIDTGWGARNVRVRDSEVHDAFRWFDAQRRLAEIFEAQQARNEAMDDVAQPAIDHAREINLGVAHAATELRWVINNAV